MSEELSHNDRSVQYDRRLVSSREEAAHSPAPAEAFPARALIHLAKHEDCHRRKGACLHPKTRRIPEELRKAHEAHLRQGRRVLGTHMASLFR